MIKEKQKDAEIKCLKTDLDMLQTERQELRYGCCKLERQAQDYKEENVKLLRQCLKLYRALMKQRDEAEKVMETCAHNVWFCQIKERTY